MTEREMKSYEERLPLIDAAIEELGGKWPNSDYDIESYLVKLDTGTYVLTAGLVSDPRCNICNRTQFEKRAKELGYINGYKWGVEYKTNGEKPDLPGDTVIEIESTGGDRDLGSRFVKYNDWTRTKSFRIVDGRYKPKEQEMNDWYEKGELPPVGTTCEYRNNRDEWAVGDIFGHRSDSQGNVSAYINLSGGKNWDYSSQAARFRPLRSETDKLVEQAMSLFSKTEATTDAKVGIEHAVTVLIEKGYRKIKQMSEQEFMKQCVDICGHGSTLLYRADCRFIEQVKA